jgi:hypothetical protein
MACPEPSSIQGLCPGGLPLFLNSGPFSFLLPSLFFFPPSYHPYLAQDEEWKVCSKDGGRELEEGKDKCKTQRTQEQG